MYVHYTYRSTHHRLFDLSVESHNAADAASPAAPVAACFNCASFHTVPYVQHIHSSLIVH